MKLIALTKGKFAQVDDEHFEELNKLKWCARAGGNTFYAENKKEKTSLHRFIMKCKKGDGRKIDHKNRNGLDCQEHNLRDCNFSQNCINKEKIKRQCSSQYKGVHFDKEKKLWRAAIAFNKKDFKLGRFKTEQEAAIAYNKKAIEFFGEFAFLNVIILNKTQ